MEPKLVDSIPMLDGLPASSRNLFSLTISRMADGSFVSLPVNVMVGKDTGPRLLLVAGVHGDEYEGIAAQLELWDELNPEILSGSVVMVPVANPPAFRAGQRRNPEDMLDMNRAFPGKKDGSITEQLAFRLFHEVALKVDFVLSMHGWIRGSMVVPYIEYPRNSVTTAACLAAAKAFGLEYVEAFDWNDGLLVAECTHEGIPAIEPEIGGLACTVPSHRFLYKQGVLNLLRHLGMVTGKEEGSILVREVSRSMTFAPVGGILRQHKSLREVVKSGEAIATICDLNGSHLFTCYAPGNGFIAAQNLMAAVNPGDLIDVIFTPEDI